MSEVVSVWETWTLTTPGPLMMASVHSYGAAILTPEVFRTFEILTEYSPGASGLTEGMTWKLKFGLAFIGVTWEMATAPVGPRREMQAGVKEAASIPVVESIMD